MSGPAGALLTGIHPTSGGPHVCVDNALSRYYSELVGLVGAARAAPVSGFDPGYELPPLDSRLDAFFSPSTISWQMLHMLPGATLSLLDLRSNPATRTTKTLASLLMVARAVAHIHRTGERITIVTPSSANKATALRDAVWRAISCGLVEEDQLQIICVVPAHAMTKLWWSPLAEHAARRRRNPILTYQHPQRDAVKALVSSFAATVPAGIERSGVRLWFTMSLANYKLADAIRAFVEQDYLPPQERIHAHAVSSAFGLLGHAHGVVHRGGRAVPPYFLVQHLDTPDMVLDLCTGSFDRAGLPPYTRDPASGLYVQDLDPHFPRTTHDPTEVLEPTFYTHAPATASTMTAMIRRHGGGGIVVSLHECLEKYARIRGTLDMAGIELPSDPRELREWSLVMALTGALNAVERQILPADREIVVHASGSYGTADFDPVPSHLLTAVADENDLAEYVAAAAGG